MMVNVQLATRRQDGRRAAVRTGDVCAAVGCHLQLDRPRSAVGARPNICRLLLSFGCFCTKNTQRVPCSRKRPDKLKNTPLEQGWKPWTWPWIQGPPSQLILGGFVRKPGVWARGNLRFPSSFERVLPESHRKHAARTGSHRNPPEPTGKGRGWQSQKCSGDGKFKDSWTFDEKCVF